MKRTSRLFTSRKISLAAVSFLSLASIATAAVPYAETNPFERSTFGNEWGILDSDIFFGGAGALFGLSPASRTLLLFPTSASTTNGESRAMTSAANSSDDVFSFALPSSPFSIRGRGPVSGGGGLAPAITGPDYYWDTNGAQVGLGGPVPGTWDTSALNKVWNDASGTGEASPMG
jgi:hypothetical protein